MTNTQKGIAQTMIEVLKENNTESIMFGDCVFLDECASRCKHTNLMEQHPLNRHQRIFRALENSKLFKKYFIRLNGMRGNNLVRLFKIVK